MNFFTPVNLSKNRKETPEGYLLCLNVPIARTGDMIYSKGELPGIEADNEGKIVVYRDPLEVFRPETIASFEGKSLTLWHPSEMVDPKNWSAVTKGIVQNVRRGDNEYSNDLLADILVTDARAIELIKGGLCEVSCGYEADYITTGVGRAIQKNIVGNHLAMVDEGRAGASYKIMDQNNGKGNSMTLTDKIKAVFSKNQDEALKLITEVETKDKAAASVPTLDEVMKGLKALNAAIEKLATKDLLDVAASTQPTQSAPAEVKAVDAEVAPSLEDRMKKLEEAVAKLLEGQAVTGDEDKEEKKEEKSEDEASEEKEEKKEEKSEDEACEDEEGEEEKEMTGDEKSRIEILAPGAKLSGKDAKAKALTAAYATKDGKAVIERFTGGKALDLKNEKFIDAVFIGASEIMKEIRTSEFARSKTRDAQVSHSALSPKGAMTADALNKKNQEFYAKR